MAKIFEPQRKTIYITSTLPLRREILAVKWHAHKRSKTFGLKDKKETKVFDLKYPHIFK
jgi:hypothetical protein